MSELQEELLIPGITRKRVISVVIIAGLLVTAFAFSTFFISAIFGSQRVNPNERLEDAEYEDAELMDIPLPFDEDFLMDLFSDLDLDAEELAEVIKMLSEMFDGNIDDFNLPQAAAALAALLFSEEEVFRIYDYESFNANLSKILWKYETFDQYEGDSWNSTSTKDMYDFYSYGNYYSKHTDADIFTLKMPLSASDGLNSLVLPSLFPTPFIMEDGVEGSNLNQESTVLYKDEFNSSTIDLEFTQEGQVNITYELFGADLPTNEEINQSAVDESYTPLEIQSRYLQLPPTVETYVITYPNFKTHYDNLDALIEDGDHAFMVANKIRNYLQSNFDVGLNALTNDPPEQGDDVVEWFCEHEEGLWTEFASAFCVFTRAFGVASRFVDGFNSRGIEPINDTNEGKEAFSIKYKNIFNWAEVYIPTDTSGNGQWVQMDVIFDTFGEGGGINMLTDVELDLTSNFTSGYRPQIATLTATLTSSGNPLSGEHITFVDLTSGADLGEATTDSNGEASIQVNISDSQVVGPHYIQAAYYDPITYLYTYAETNYTIYGNVDIILQSVSPNQVDRRFSNQTNVRGYVEDPVNGERVQFTDLEIVLLNSVTNNKLFMPFNIIYINTNFNGEFDVDLEVDPNVPQGDYFVRVDFNGTWYGGLFDASNYLSNSSNKLSFRVLDDLPYKIHFYINGFDADDYYNPSRIRYSYLELNASVFDTTGNPIIGENVTFYDYTLNKVINTTTTNAIGSCRTSYYVNTSSVAGPNLLYAKYKGLENHSYYILNEIPTITINSGPSPREINRTSPGITEFDVLGSINDIIGNPLDSSEVTLILLKNGADSSVYLSPNEAYPYKTDGTGVFDLTFGVDPSTPLGNYTLRMDFNGTFDFTDNPKPFTFYLNSLSISNEISKELKVNAGDVFIFDFWINGTTSDDYNNPVISRNGDLNLTVYIQEGADPVDGQTVDFYDVTQDNLYIGSGTTSSGYAQLIYSTDVGTIAGPHLIYAQYDIYENYSYYILDDEIDIDLKVCPDPREVYKNTASDPQSGTIFWINGFLSDTSNSKPIKNGGIAVKLLDGPSDVSSYLNFDSGSLQCDQNGEFNVYYRIDNSAPLKNYTLQVWFNGTFIFTNPNYPHTYSLTSYANFSKSAEIFELKVLFFDPDNVKIFFYIDSTATSSFYDDINPPEQFTRGDSINFTVHIYQGGSEEDIDVDTVSLYDVYNNSQLINSITPFPRYYEFNVDTSSWYVGLHRIRVEWSGKPDIFNYTYVIIDDFTSVNIFTSLSDDVIQRYTESFTVSGHLKESGVYLRGLRIKLLLLNSTGQDVSSKYLNLIGPQTITIDNDGTYSYDISSISLDCPQGDYFIRIDFYGSMIAPGLALYTPGYVTSNSSVLVQGKFNVTAGTTIIEVGSHTEYEPIFPNDWVIGDTLYVYGNLTWDNTTAMANMNVTITITELDGTTIIDSITTLTDVFGGFNGSLTIDSTWPDYRDLTRIFVSFDPSNPDNFTFPDYYYINSSKTEFTT